MNRLTTCVAIALMLISWQTVGALDMLVTGTVAVTVSDKDGKPAEGVSVRITAHGQAAPNPAPRLADEAPTSQPATPIAEGRTDKDGKLTLEKVPAGDFNLSANLRGQGSARQKISVKAGETLKVDLKLIPRAPTPPPAPAK